MSTSTKLEYLNTTKGLIKDSINLTGANILSTDTFRSYATKLKNAYIDIINNGIDTLYSNFPKVTAEGTEIVLNNTYEAPLKINVVKGDTQQNSYSGKNLFNSFVIQKSTVQINEDGEMLISGITTTNGYCSTNKTLSQLCPSLQVNDVVYLYLETDFYESGSLKNYIYIDSNWRNGNSKTITQAMLDANVIVYGGYQTTSHLKIMVTRALDTNYEPYVGGKPSPSPDYPQNINVVTGEQIVSVSGKNLFNLTSETHYENVSVNINDNEVSLTWTAGFNCYLNDTMQLDSTKTYTISFLHKGASIKVFRNGSNNDYFTTGVNNDYTLIQHTFTGYSDFQIAIIRDGSTANVSAYLKNIQFEEGSTATTYQPYKSATYTVDLGTLESCKIGDYQDTLQKSSGKNLCNSKTINSYAGSTGNINASASNQYLGVEDKIAVEPNTTYTIIFFGYDVGTFNYATYDKNGDFIERITGVSKTFTTSTNVYYIFPYLYQNSGPFTKTDTYVQLEKGTSSTEYEPFGKVWYKKSMIGKYVYNNDLTSNGIDENRVGMITPVLNIQPNLLSVDNLLFCNIFSRTYANYTGLNGTTSTSKIRVNINLSYATTYEEARTIYSNKNLTIYYQLATPTYEVITDSTLITQLETIKKSYEDKTYITISGNLPMIINASALEKE